MQKDEINVTQAPRKIPVNDFLRLRAVQARYAEARRAFEDAEALMNLTVELMRERYGIALGEAVEAENGGGRDQGLDVREWKNKNPASPL